MEEKNTINYNNIVEAGKALKAIVVTIILSIVTIGIIFFISTNVDLKADTIMFINIIGIILFLIFNIICLVYLYQAGRNLEGIMDDNQIASTASGKGTSSPVNTEPTITVKHKVSGKVDKVTMPYWEKMKEMYGEENYEILND